MGVSSKRGPPMAISAPLSDEVLVRVALVGDAKVGKSSLVSRIVADKFAEVSKQNRARSRQCLLSMKIFLRASSSSSPSASLLRVCESTWPQNRPRARKKKSIVISEIGRKDERMRRRSRRKKVSKFLHVCGKKAN